MKLNQLKGKKILILGLGREGEAAFLFLRKLFPKKILGLADKAELKKLNLKFQKLIKQDFCVELYLGENYLEAIKDYEVIIKSPGIPPKIIQPFLGKRAKITSQTEIFFENCPGRIIGITGTKGKSTTSTFIYKVLKSGGIPDVNLIGNIGKPAISFLEKAGPKSFFVYELSSHQLMELKKSPEIAVILNIYPEHLDYYKDFKEYAAAKSNIACWQKREDVLIFNLSNPIVRKIAKMSKARKFGFSILEQTKQSFKLASAQCSGCFIDGGEIFYYSLETNDAERIMRADEIKLAGRFNVINAMPAVIIGKIFGVPTEKIVRAIKNFKGLPHRLEFVGRRRGIKFYNDSLATIPEATIEALNSLGDDAKTLILGGYDRGINFDYLAKSILRGSIKTLIFFPTSGQIIWKEILKQGSRVKSRRMLRMKRAFFTDNMREAVRIAYKYTNRGKICLLSCASPSFGIFKNYKERGNLFKKYVRDLGRNNS